jgi:asparagine synthase (glutamine-hydrolysing)
MCGFYLRISDDSKSNSLSEFDIQNLEQIKVRGPDKFYLHEDLDLGILHGFARLAVRSISKGDQPWVESRFTSAFNGEIYNTEQLGFKIKLTYPKEEIPESDTQLLALFIFLFGPDSISEVIGMFAGYIQVKSKIFLFRDRVGEKPIFYGFYEKFFFISSCLPKSIYCNEQITDYSLVSGLIENNFSNGVSMLSPGAYIEVDISNLFSKVNLVEKKYWTWPKRRRFISESNLEDFETIVVKSIETQLVSDVGMSVLLSGGIDSGLVAAFARRAYGSNLESFTLAFNGSAYSEANNAIKTAKHLELKHEIVDISFEELAENVDEVFDAMDVPIFDSGALSLFSLCKKIARTQKVSLTGDGGDELFRGYSIYGKTLTLNMLAHIPLSPLFSIYLKYIDWLSERKDKYLGPELKLKRAWSVNSNIGVNPLFGAIGPLGGTELFNYICSQNNFDLLNDKKIITKKIIEDYFTHEILPKIYLVKSDRMSMSNGIELRSPLLDFRVINSAFGFSELSSIFKSRKQQLRKLAVSYLPAEILIGNKHGFSAPFHNVVKYLDKPDWTSPRDEKELSLFNKIWYDALDGKESAGTPAWNILVREHFHKKALKY